MGHIRLGRLPKTKHWPGVFHALEGDRITTPELAQAVATAAQQELAALEGDRGINYCYWILVRIATAARGDDFAARLAELGVRMATPASGVGLVREVAQAVERGLRERGEPTVFRRIAELSLREVLSANIIEQSRSLFGTSLDDIRGACRTMSTRTRFGEVAREFFARLMSRTIRYVTDKEISNHVGPDKALASPRQVLEFQQALDRHCMETARILEDFAAGWFSKHNWETNNNIPEDAAAGFTAYAFQKIQMELRKGKG